MAKHITDLVSGKAEGVEARERLETPRHQRQVVPAVGFGVEGCGVEGVGLRV